MAGGGGGGKGKKNALNINMTPMIDCTMLLVIFFLFTTQMASPDFISLQLPRPHNSLAREQQSGNKAVINVIPYPNALPGSPQEGKAMEYRLDTEHYVPTVGDKNGDLKRMGEKLTKLRQVNAAYSADPNKFMVSIRADYRTTYADIEPILQELQLARIQAVHIAAFRPK